MRAIIALVRAPLFSVRRPATYQAASAYPLPQPSTLVGALAYALTVAYGGVKSLRGDSYVEECCRRVLNKLIRAAVKPLAPLSCSSLTLSRMRTLELLSGEVVKRVESGRKITDAMVREYFYGRLGLIYVFRSERIAERARAALYLVERLGDTESCVNVERAEEAELQPQGREGEVDTYTPADWLERVWGSFSLDNMCPESLAAKVRRARGDVVGGAVKYVVPLYEMRSGLFKPSPYKVRTREGYIVWRARAEGLKMSVVLPRGGSR